MSHDIQRQKVLDVRQLFINEVQVTATASELSTLAGVTAVVGDVNLLAGMNAAGERVTHVAKVALAAVDTGGGIFAWQNPAGVSIIVHKVIIDVATVATGACTIDVGTTATSATTLSDNMIDGLDVHTATGTFGIANGADLNGVAQQKLAAGKWVTGSKASGASAGLVGTAYIHYHLA